MIKNIGFAFTGCFCAHQNVIEEVRKLTKAGYNIVPILSEHSASIDTRFGKASELKKTLKELTGNTPIETIVGVEPLGPKNLIDILVVAPCSGNTLAKLANGVNDTSVTMAVKSMLRNNKPIVIGFTTNDAMGANFKNIALLMQTKNFYFVPFGQDDFNAKPKSLASDWTKIEDTINEASKGKQIQPVVVEF